MSIADSVVNMETSARVLIRRSVAAAAPLRLSPVLVASTQIRSSFEEAPVEPAPVTQVAIEAKGKSALGEDVQAVLSGAVFTEDSVKRTAALDRALYCKVNKALESMGGIWNRKGQAHIFAQDPRQLFDLMAASWRPARFRLMESRLRWRRACRLLRFPSCSYPEALSGAHGPTSGYPAAAQNP